MDKKIKLVLINGRAMVFNADDYMKIRQEYRLLGRLIGTAPPKPRNVFLLHLPAYYNCYETRLMLEEKIAILEDKKYEESPSVEVKEAYKKYQEDVSKYMENCYIKMKLESTVYKMDEIITGKKNKLMKSGVPESEIVIDPESILKEEEERHRKTFIQTPNLHCQVPTEYPFKCPTTTVKTFPVESTTKYRIFHDLWKKGFFITNGDNFGGDFLTYNGDPIYYHATQIVHVIEDWEKLIEPHSLSSFGRLSVSVKKKCVFAYIRDDKIVYQTLDWDNPKLRGLQNSTEDTSVTEKVNDEINE